MWFSLLLFLLCLSLRIIFIVFIAIPMDVFYQSSHNKRFQVTFSRQIVPSTKENSSSRSRWKASKRNKENDDNTEERDSFFQICYRKVIWARKSPFLRIFNRVWRDSASYPSVLLLLFLLLLLLLLLLLFYLFFCCYSLSLSNSFVVITNVYTGVAVKIVYQSLHHKKVAVLITPNCTSHKREQFIEIKMKSFKMKKKIRKEIMIEKNDKNVQDRQRREKWWGKFCLIATAFKLIFWNESTATRFIRSNRRCWDTFWYHYTII